MKKLILFVCLALGCASFAVAQCPHHGSCSHSASCSSQTTDSLNIPVYIVDGVEVSPELVAEIDPSDIVSVKVSKDRNLCQLFAPRLGGIIMITTRSKTYLKQAKTAYETAQQKAKEKAQKEGKVMIR